MSDQIGASSRDPSAILAARILVAGSSLSTKQTVLAVGTAILTAQSSIPTPLKRLMMGCEATSYWTSSPSACIRSAISTSVKVSMMFSLNCVAVMTS